MAGVYCSTTLQWQVFTALLLCNGRCLLLYYFAMTGVYCSTTLQWQVFTVLLLCNGRCLLFYYFAMAGVYCSAALKWQVFTVLLLCNDSNFVLGNAQANGWPIVYCSDGFCELTGFSRASVMAKGSGCRFLYGPETSEAEVQKIQEALEEKRELKTELQFYNKNGTPFWCLLDIVPIKNEKRDVVLFLVSHKDITKDKEKKEPDSLSGKSNSDGSSDEDNENEDEGMPENYDYGRRRSRAVLYHISGQLNKHNKAKSKLQQLNRLASQMPEYKVQEVKKSGLIIVHYGIFKIGWDWLILLCTFYLAIMVPFNAAFKRDARFVYFDAGVEVLFAIDIVLNFRTTFLNKSGQVVYDSRLIALNYIRGWFLLDLLAAIPFDVMYAFSGETEDSNNSM
ncbi:potassium voltage-gated channel subfamily H member 4 isoform X3, partial [Biomphalaria glabrata]